MESLRHASNNQSAVIKLGQAKERSSGYRGCYRRRELRRSYLHWVVIKRGADWKTGEAFFTTGQRSFAFSLSPVLFVTPGILMSFYIPREAASN